MKREELGDLVAFLAVAEARSFTRAAARLGTSQSALSHTVRRLEERLNVRLLTRTTRSVTPTEAGERLAETLRPGFDEIRAGLEAVSDFNGGPAGTIRLTSGRHAAEAILFPTTLRLMRTHPQLNVEIAIDHRLTDIVADRFDAGVRLGEQIEKDMIAVRIGPDIRMAVVASPSYLASNPAPVTPRDLTGHSCINLRMPTSGGLYAWEFEKDGQVLNVRVEGRFTSNDPDTVVLAALDGMGLACLPGDRLAPLIQEGRLVRVLEDWCPPFPGYHLYYPSRRQQSPALRALVEALRWRG